MRKKQFCENAFWVVAANNGFDLYNEKGEKVAWVTELSVIGQGSGYSDALVKLRVNIAGSIQEMRESILSMANNPDFFLKGTDLAVHFNTPSEVNMKSAAYYGKEGLTRTP